MELVKQITIKHKAVERAAMFVLFNNKFINYTLEQVCDIINRMVDDAVTKITTNPDLDHYTTSTMGVTVHISYESPEYAVVDVLVDPGVSMNYDYDILYEAIN